MRGTELNVGQAVIPEPGSVYNAVWYKSCNKPYLQEGYIVTERWSFNFMIILEAVVWSAGELFRTNTRIVSVN